MAPHYSFQCHTTGLVRTWSTTSDTCNMYKIGTKTRKQTRSRLPPKSVWQFRCLEYHQPSRPQVHIFVLIWSCIRAAVGQGPHSKLVRVFRSINISKIERCRVANMWSYVRCSYICRNAGRVPSCGRSGMQVSCTRQLQIRIGQPLKWRVPLCRSNL